jgi:ankyrin repeat protein
LIDAGACLTLRDVNGLTALDLAERNGHGKCVEILKAAVGEFSIVFFKFHDFSYHIFLYFTSKILSIKNALN